MKVVNMTQLARQSKSVIEDAINSKALVVTPGSKDNVVMVSEDHYNAIIKANEQMAIKLDGTNKH